MSSYTHLLVDISNSWTKCAPSTLTHVSNRVRRVPTSQLDAAWVARLARQYPRAIWWVSSVVPSRNALFVRKIPKERLFFLNATCRLGIGIDYPQPGKIGADRLANAVAAAHLYGAPSIVVDFGTAVTFDVISREKAYVGGVIAPGLGAMTDYLHEKTALLPRIQIRAPKGAVKETIRVIGKSTVEAMHVGAIIGYRGLVQEILAALCKEMGERSKLHILATGGDAVTLARYIPEIDRVHPLLTLEGLRLAAKFQI